MNQPARVFIAGISGSGKTTGAWTWYLSKSPRVIIVDQIGEWEGRVLETVNTLSELFTAINAARKHRKWVISYTNADSRLHDLIRWLLPLPNVDQSPSKRMGGIVLMLDEVDLIAPAGGAPEVIRNLYRRSRHANLTIVSATQRPANVLREVSAQSTHVLAYRLTEPRDRDYLVDLMRWDQARLGEYVRWTQQHQHGAVWRDLQTGQTLWIPDRGHPQTSTGERPAKPANQRIPPETQRQLPARETVRSPESSSHATGDGASSKAPMVDPATPE